MRGNLSNKIRMQHILDAITDIEKYITKRDFKDFLNYFMMRFECIRQMEIIGEQAIS